MATSKVKPMKICVGMYSDFLKCSGSKDLDEYYVSWSKFDGEKMNYCKVCADKIFKYYLKETDSLKSALWLSGSVLHFPFNSEIYENLEETIKKGGKISNVSLSTYLSILRRKTSTKDVLSDFDATNVDLKDIDTKVKSIEVKENELKEYQNKWGEQSDIKDYEFLEYTYNRYMTNFENDLTPQQEDVLRDLVRDRLLLRKLGENGCQDNDMITKVQTRLNTLMKTLKIDNFEVAQKRTLSEQSFIEKIKIMEETKPIELYAKEDFEYADYTKRKKYYEDLVLRPLCNTLAGHKDFNIDMADLEQYNIRGDK